MTNSTPATRPGKRERLVTAARQILHAQGIEQTTLADVATAADVPLGNVYYYFRTKDALVAAVVDTYRSDYEALIAGLDRRRSPQARLKALVDSWGDRREMLTAHGCPVGSLNAELGKGDSATRGAAATVLRQLVDWCAGQFAAMGRRDARELGVALVAAYEGVALLAHTLQDPELLRAEARRLTRWIDELAATAAH